jgi:signal transduction histidine kinase
MTERVRGRLAAFFGPSIVSGRALLWFFPIGVLLIVVTIPRDGSVAVTDAKWWVIAFASQSALTLVIVVLGRLTVALTRRRSAVTWRALVVIFGGAARGAVIALLILTLEPPLAPPGSIALRSANSALICCLWLGLIGLLIQAGRDYRSDYRLLLSRAVALHRAENDSTIDVDAEMVERWANVQSSMRETMARVRLRLGETETAPSGADLAAAAAVVNDAVIRDVRPTSHGLWFTTEQAPPRLRPGALLWDALSDWRLPLRPIAGILCAIAFIGGIIRSGLLIGIGFASLYVVCSMTLLWVSDRVARRVAGPAVGIATVLLLPWVLLGLAIVIGQGILHVSPDNGGAAVAAVATSIVAFGMLLLSRVSGERRVLLDALQLRIESSAVVVLARQERRRESERELGVFLHHSVQSELSAVAMHLGEAATSSDDELRKTARAEALNRIVRIQESTPPWSAEAPGPDRIEHVVQSWEGIAAIEVDLPPLAAVRSDQWKLLAQLVEEAVANAIRAGGANRIRVNATTESGVLTVLITDNGHLLDHDQPRLPGMGTAWLDHVAPGGWELRDGQRGTSLRVDLR